MVRCLPIPVFLLPASARIHTTRTDRSLENVSACQMEGWCAVDVTCCAGNVDCLLGAVVLAATSSQESIFFDREGGQFARLAVCSPHSCAWCRVAPRSFGDFANVSGVMIWGFVSSWIIIPLLRRLKNQEGLLDLLIAFMLSAAWMTSAFVVGLAWAQIFKIATTQ